MEIAKYLLLMFCVWSVALLAYYIVMSRLVAIKYTLRDRYPPAYWAGCVLGAGFMVADVIYNWLPATVMFWDAPREYTLTSRMRRYKREEPARWRGRIAWWVCGLLNRFDPTGTHC